MGADPTRLNLDRQGRHQSGVSASPQPCLAANSARLRAGGYFDCLAAAREIASTLLAEGKRPWIVRLRRMTIRRGRVFHLPIVPYGLGLQTAWTTHYVCCCDEMAYDPVVGE